MQYCELTECKDDMKPLTQNEETLPLQALVSNPLGYPADAPNIVEF